MVYCFNNNAFWPLGCVAYERNSYLMDHMVLTWISTAVSLLVSLLFAVVGWTFKKLLGRLEEDFKEIRIHIDHDETALAELKNNVAILDHKVDFATNLQQSMISDIKGLVQLESRLNHLLPEMQRMNEISKDLHEAHRLIRERKAENEMLQNDIKALRERSHFIANKLSVLKLAAEKKGAKFKDDWTMP